MEITSRLILFIIIVIYSRLLWILRYKFRSSVYKDKTWKINFRLWFRKEIIALFSNKYFTNHDERKWGNIYRAYLAGFAFLWLLFKIAG